MSRPTTGGTLWKPSNLTQEEGKPQHQACGSTQPLTPSASSLPVQVKSCDLRVVPFKVGEVEEIYVCLCVSRLSAPQKDTSVSTDKDGCLGERARCCGFHFPSYFMGLSMACP